MDCNLSQTGQSLLNTSTSHIPILDLYGFNSCSNALIKYSEVFYLRFEMPYVLCSVTALAFHHQHKFQYSCELMISVDFE